jgi:hypothetical protein
VRGVSVTKSREPDSWPRDPYGHIFLARLVEKVGVALYGSDWPGAEHFVKTAEGLELLPPDSLERLHAVQSKIVEWNEAGEIKLEIHSRRGGPWRDFDRDWWKIDGWRSHFYSYRIDPDYPNHDRPSWRDDNDHWIFATLQGINAILKKDKHPGGRPPFPRWQILKTEALRLLEKHGNFTLNKPKWNAQARLEEALLDHCQNKLKLKDDDMPGTTQLREHVHDWYEGWRTTRQNQ